jgi:hypothetical protein
MKKYLTKAPYIPVKTEENGFSQEQHVTDSRCNNYMVQALIFKMVEAKCMHLE